MTPKQATEIREHLINELNVNGFNQIVTEINTRLEENYDEKDFEKTPNYLLFFFLTESIEILDSLSNKNFNEILETFNKYNRGENSLESIAVELLNQGESIKFDLKDLPDYSQITETFRNILDEIRNEN